MDPTSSKEAYNTWHRLYEVNENATEIWYEKVKASADSNRDFCNRRVLEIGCGRGGFACWLASQSFAPREVVAADYSSSAVAMGTEFSRRSGISNITWREADIQQIPYCDGAFDTVVSCETIEHVPNPRKAIHELVRVLKTGGRLFLTTPNYLNLFGVYRGYKRIRGRPYQEAGQPINKFVMLPRTLFWVRQAGISVEEYGSTDLVIPRLGRPPRHIAPPRVLSTASKWFGLQSFVFGVKSW